MNFQFKRFKILFFCLFWVAAGCQSNPETAIHVPVASSDKLMIRQDQYKRSIDKYTYSDRNSADNSQTVGFHVNNGQSGAHGQAYAGLPPKSLPQSANTDERRLALVIGNSNYIHGGKLRNPVNDARAMSNALKKLNFDVIPCENAGQANFKRAIDDFGNRLSGYNVALFYYAGHGIQVNGENYLIPIDADIKTENDVEYNCVEANRVLAKMEDAGSRTNIVILDACRDNPFERSWRRSAKGSGLAFMNAPSGSLIAYATSPGNTAADGHGVNGVYTEALLKNMQIPNITILDMFMKVRDSVINKTNKEQIPWESTSLMGNFYFKIDVENN